MIDNPSRLAPSTLSDVIERVRSMFSGVGAKIPIQVGEHWLRANQGSPPKIVFVPEDSGSIGDAIVAGHAASWNHGCEVIVRAKPGIQEHDRFEPAYSLAGKVIAALAVACSGRIRWGAVGRDNITTDDRLAGVGVRFSFQFRRDIPHWSDIWCLPVGEDYKDKTIYSPQDLAVFTPPGAPETPALEVAIGAIVVPTVTPEDQ